jgi:hypothetical protein
MTVITIKHFRAPRIEPVRRLARARVFGVPAAARNILRRGTSSRLAAAGAAVALAVSSLLIQQPTANALGVTLHKMVVRYDYVQFTQVSDGCCYDNTLEVYGSVGAHTATGSFNEGNLPYRNFGTWGKDPCEVTWSYLWNASYGNCSKKVQVGVWAFSDLHYCASNTYSTCPYYSYPDDNYLMLTVLSGETITFDVRMKDYDSASADDNVCVGSLTVGPFTDSQLSAMWWSTPFGGTIKMPWNGNGACSAHVTMYDY